MHAIEFTDVTFAYAEDLPPVLRAASFVVEPGEFVALVGTNGSGKSTIAKMTDAFLAPQGGSVRVLGLDVGEIGGTSEAFDLRRRVGFVFQNPDDQLVASIAIDEVAFGPANLGVAREDLIERVDAALAAVGMTQAAGRNVNTLSGGQRQRIAIADALAMRPDLLVLDEPTSMLDVQGRHDVREILQRLHADGLTILLVTHDPAEAALADRVLHVKEGRVCSLDLSELSAQETPRGVHKVGEHEAAAQADARKANDHEAAAQAGEPLIRFQDVSFSYGKAGAARTALFTDTRDEAVVFEHLNLEVRAGETLAIAGPNGSGKTTLIQHMNGLLKPTAGTVSVNGIDTASRAGANAARRVVGISFQYPERSLFSQTVFDEVAFGPRNLGLGEEEVDARVREALAGVALPFEAFAKREPFKLSGGEQRKVAIASVLALQPKVLVLDEPCASMDLPTHAHFIELFDRLKRQGQTMVLVTHDERDIELLADRVFRLEARQG